MTAQYLSGGRPGRKRNSRTATQEEIETIAMMLGKNSPHTIATKLKSGLEFVLRNIPAAREMKRTMEGR